MQNLHPLEKNSHKKHLFVKKDLKILLNSFVFYLFTNFLCLLMNYANKHFLVEPFYYLLKNKKKFTL
jgi:hypothetical protein